MQIERAIIVLTVTLGLAGCDAETMNIESEPGADASVGSDDDGGDTATATCFGEETDNNGVLLPRLTRTSRNHVAMGGELTLQYELAGFLESADDVLIDVLSDADWPTWIEDADGNSPPEIRFSPVEKTVSFAVGMEIPSEEASRTIVVRARSCNDSSTRYVYGFHKLVPGAAAPAVADDIDIRLLNTALNIDSLPIRVPEDKPFATLNFRIVNHSDATVPLNLEYTSTDTEGGWTMLAGTPPEGGWIARPYGVIDTSVTVIRPDVSGEEFELRVQAAGKEIFLPFVTVN